MASVIAAEPKVGLDLSTWAAGGPDQATGVLVEQLAVDPRLVEVALKRGQRAQAEQVVHSCGVLRPQRHMGECAAARDVVAAVLAGFGVTPAHSLALGTVRLGGDIGFHADNRLDAARLRSAVELVGTEGVSVVGYRDSRHAEPLATGEQIADSRRPIEHRVVRVHVQVDE